MSVVSLLLGGRANLGVEVNPSLVSATGTNAGNLTTNAATATVTGGSGSPTYLWEYVSGETFTITTPTAASTTFSSGISAGEQLFGVYKCTVTSGGVTASDTVSVFIQDNGGYWL